MNNSILTKVVVIGAGSWGTALAYLASHNAEEILCYVRDQSVMQGINNKNINAKIAPNRVLPQNIRATTKAGDLMNAQAFVVAVPAQQMRLVLTEIKDTISCNINAPIIICSKGIENYSNKLMSQVVEDLGIVNQIIILSGPNFAQEILQDKSSAATIASNSQEALNLAEDIFKTKNFSLEKTKDVIGVQICGAIKNVYAIGAGIAHGLKFGENFHAAFLKNVIFEMRHILQVIGCDEETIFTYAGIGDLFLTCSNITSRNMQFGVSIANNEIKQEILSKTTVEGYYTANSLSILLNQRSMHQFNLINVIKSIVFEGKSPNIISQTAFISNPN